MNTRTCLRWLGFFLLFSAFAKLGHSADLPANGTLEVMVEDANGSVVPNAHVYIYSKDKHSFEGTKDAFGSANFELPAGEYRVYAALTTNNHGIVDHYSSPEAKVRLNPEEPSSIILSLEKADDSEIYLSDTALKKMGIDDDLAKYLN